MRKKTGGVGDHFRNEFDNQYVLMSMILAFHQHFSQWNRNQKQDVMHFRVTDLCLVMSTDMR